MGNLHLIGDAHRVEPLGITSEIALALGVDYTPAELLLAGASLLMALRLLVLECLLLLGDTAYRVRYLEQSAPGIRPTSLAFLLS